MASRTALVGVLAYCAMLLTAHAQDASDQPTPTAAEDCAVIAAIGENRLKWREKSPHLPMLAGSYGADCDFKPMGVKPFDIPPLDSDSHYFGPRFSFSKPDYSGDGLQAKVTYTIGGDENSSSDFSSETNCSAVKAKGQWRVTVCK